MTTSHSTFENNFRTPKLEHFFIEYGVLNFWCMSTKFQPESRRTVRARHISNNYAKYTTVATIDREKDNM